MPNKSGANKTVRKSAKDIPPASKADLDRLRAAMRRSIDMSEIPERRKFHVSSGMPVADFHPARERAFPEPVSRGLSVSIDGCGE